MATPREDESNADGDFSPRIWAQETLTEAAHKHADPRVAIISQLAEEDFVPPETWQEALWILGDAAPKARESHLVEWYDQEVAARHRSALKAFSQNFFRLEVYDRRQQFNTLRNIFARQAREAVWLTHLQRGLELRPEDARCMTPLHRSLLEALQAIFVLKPAARGSGVRSFVAPMSKSSRKHELEQFFLLNPGWRGLIPEFTDVLLDSPVVPAEQLAFQTTAAMPNRPIVMPAERPREQGTRIGWLVGIVVVLLMALGRMAQSPSSTGNKSFFGQKLNQPSRTVNPNPTAPTPVSSEKLQQALERIREANRSKAPPESPKPAPSKMQMQVATSRLLDAESSERLKRQVERETHELLASRTTGEMNFVFHIPEPASLSTEFWEAFVFSRDEDRYQLERVERVKLGGKLNISPARIFLIPPDAESDDAEGQITVEYLAVSQTTVVNLNDVLVPELQVNDAEDVYRRLRGLPHEPRDPNREARAKQELEVALEMSTECRQSLTRAELTRLKKQLANEAFEIRKYAKVPHEGRLVLIVPEASLSSGEFWKTWLTVDGDSAFRALDRERRLAIADQLGTYPEFIFLLPPESLR